MELKIYLDAFTEGQESVAQAVGAGACDLLSSLVAPVRKVLGRAVGFGVCAPTEICPQCRLEELAAHMHGKPVVFLLTPTAAYLGFCAAEGRGHVVGHAWTGNFIGPKGICRKQLISKLRLAYQILPCDQRMHISAFDYGAEVPACTCAPTCQPSGHTAHKCVLAKFEPVPFGGKQVSTLKYGEKPAGVPKKVMDELTRCADEACLNLLKARCAQLQ